MGRADNLSGNLNRSTIQSGHCNFSDCHATWWPSVLRFVRTLQQPIYYTVCQIFTRFWPIGWCHLWSSGL